VLIAIMDDAYSFSPFVLFAPAITIGESTASYGGPREKPLGERIREHPRLGTGSA